MPLELGVLVSGNGTNLQAILDAIARGTLDARVRVVISNRRDAFALERARTAGAPALAIPHGGFESREAFDRALVAALREHGVEWVVLAGFMRLLTPELLFAFRGRIVNVHPALLPAFPGTHAIRRALEAGAAVTGCTVHFVDEGVDTGTIIAQREVPILPGDDEATLTERMHTVEHELFVAVLSDIAAGKVRSPAAHSPGSSG
jgi:phosphoribosylglycinamide formyltransferase-1